MVVAIVFIATVGKVISSRHRAKHGIVQDTVGNEQRVLADPDTDRMREEIRTLKERIQVLERIATDNNGANDISRQIEQLRNS